MTHFRALADAVPLGRYSDEQALTVDQLGSPVVDGTPASDPVRWMLETATKVMSEEPDDAARVWAETESRARPPDPADPASTGSFLTGIDDPVTGIVAF